MKGPMLPDVNTLIAAGFDPKTGLPGKMSNAKEGFKDNNRKLLRIMDEQDAINTFTWYNLPNGLNGRLMERILYYRGQGAFFYMKEDGKFYFLPYALDGGIDCYGRFTGITPLPFNGTAAIAKGEKEKPWITGLRKVPRYDVKLDALTLDDIQNSCVLIRDYSAQIPQTNIPRQMLQDPLLDIMAECLPMANTALRNATGVKGMRVEGEDAYNNVFMANRAIQNAALTGEQFVPIVGAMDFQELTANTVGRSEEFLLLLQAFDSYRLSMHGLPNGGLFQKKAHMLEAEQQMNSGTASLVLQDRLKNRQDCCDIINSYFGLDVWCDINESIVGADLNGDGVFYDNDSDVAVAADTAEGGMEDAV